MESRLVCKTLGSLASVYERLVCGICQDTRVNAVRVVHCDHVFCSFCIHQLLADTNSKKRCPLCNTSITKRSLVDDMESRRLLDALDKLKRALDEDTDNKWNVATGPPFQFTVDDDQDEFVPKDKEIDETAKNEGGKVDKDDEILMVCSRSMQKGNVDENVEKEETSGAREKDSATVAMLTDEIEEEDRNRVNKSGGVEMAEESEKLDETEIGEECTKSMVDKVADDRDDVENQEREDESVHVKTKKTRGRKRRSINSKAKQIDKKRCVPDTENDFNASEVIMEPEIINRGVSPVECSVQVSKLSESQVKKCQPTKQTDSVAEFSNSAPRENEATHEATDEDTHLSDSNCIGTLKKSQQIDGLSKENDIFSEATATFVEAKGISDVSGKHTAVEEKRFPVNERPRVPFRLEGTLLESKQSPVLKKKGKTVIPFHKMAPLRSLLVARSYDSIQLQSTAPGSNDGFLQSQPKQDKENILTNTGRKRSQQGVRTPLSPLKRNRLQSQDRPTNMTPKSNKESIVKEKIFNVPEESSKQAKDSELSAPLNSLNFDSQFHLSTCAFNTPDTIGQEAEDQPVTTTKNDNAECIDARESTKIQSGDSSKKNESNIGNQEVNKNDKENNQKQEDDKEIEKDPKEEEDEDSYKTPPSSELSDDEFLQCTPQAKSSRLLDSASKKFNNETFKFMSEEEARSMSMYFSSDLDSPQLVKGFLSLAECNVTKVASEATHFVVPVDDQHRLLNRSDALLLAIAGGQCVIVSGQWLRKSMELERIPQPLPKFEPLDMSGEPGPLRRREQKADLLSRFQVCLFGSFHSTAPSKALLEKVLKLCGARTVRAVSLMSIDPSLHSLMLVDPDNVVPSGEYLRSFHISEVAVVSYEWLIESVCRQRVQQVETFLMHTATNADLIRAGYKSPLVPQ